MMADYWDSLQVEARGLLDVMDFVSKYGRYATTGTDGSDLLGEWMQKFCGDLLVNLRTGRGPDGRPLYGDGFTVEVKVEAEDRYGNFFLESWSNRAFAPRKVGWMYTSQARALFYYFIASRDLYVLPFRQLWEWAFTATNEMKSPGRLYDFVEKPQGKYGQRNQTWGHPVPIRTVRDEVGFRHYRRSDGGCWHLIDSVGKHNQWPERPAEASGA